MQALDVIRKTSESLRKLMGLDAPTKTETTVNGSMTIPIVPREQLAEQLKLRIQAARAKIADKPKESGTS